jgi:hypothetical protein
MSLTVQGSTNALSTGLIIPPDHSWMTKFAAPPDETPALCLGEGRETIFQLIYGSWRRKEAIY